MSEPIFTPGPWIAHEGFAEQDYVYCKAKESSLMICKVFTRPKTEVRGCPDARLIAAAPDLLDALKHATHVCCVTLCASCLPNGAETGLATFVQNGCLRGSKVCDMAKWWEIIRKVIGEQK